MAKEIIQLGDERLRTVCEAVPEPHITDKETQTLLKDLDEALSSQSDGVAISAPQIGVTKRVFVVGGMVFDKEFQAGTSKTVDTSIPNRYYINPEITNTSRKTISMEEGCLSIRGVYGNVVRPEKITIEYFDENGEKKTEGASGFLARVLQHEYDHLNGVLFIDKAEDTWQDENYKGN
jgi:peptide deformylase